MSDTENEQMREHARINTESKAELAAHQVGIESQSTKVNQRKHNPEFYSKFVRSSISRSEKWSHLVNEHAAWLADDHVLSNRRQVYRLERQLLNKVRAEQSVVGASPGARLREKPLLNAIAQGVHPTLEQPVPLNAAGQSTITITDPDYAPPMDAEERTAMDDLAGVATARHAMGVDQAGSEALTTATTETKTVREDESEESGAIASISGAFD